MATPSSSADGSQTQQSEDFKLERGSAKRRVALAVCCGLLVAAVVLGVVLVLPRFRALRGSVDTSPDTSPAPRQSVPDRYATVEQEGARIPVGGSVQMYFVGGSNVAWQTWPDQLHAFLASLNYSVPAGNYTLPNLQFASDLAPVCDDESEFETLRTPRIARPGWGSWGFAYESTDDCELSGEQSFRKIAGHEVSCLNGWACKPGNKEEDQLVRPSQVAHDARGADVVLLSNWVNDFKQQFCGYSCFNRTVIDPVSVADITIETLSLLVRAIRDVNPTALILIIALYPDAKGAFVVPDTLDEIATINARVAAGLSNQPNTAFVDFGFPVGQEIFQTKHAGHPNCRGDRIMATRVLEVLFQHRFLARALAVPRGADADACLRAESCSDIASKACCQGAALCRVAPDGTCRAYGPGAQ